jgi:5-methyltetrahydropteroyltriglutamate--homocysteine methyltransferase
MDADVITIEASRSQMELLNSFTHYEYPNGIGPGVYDIHSPRVPSVKEILSLIDKITFYFPVNNIWINPDCGLKTRSWNETIDSLRNMVEAAKIARSRVEETSLNE